MKGVDKLLLLLLVTLHKTLSCTHDIIRLCIDVPSHTCILPIRVATGCPYRYYGISLLRPYACAY